MREVIQSEVEMMMKTAAILLLLLALPAVVYADGFHSPLVSGGDPQQWATTLRERLGIDESDSAEESNASARPGPALVGQLANLLRYLDKKNVLLSEFPNLNYDDIPGFKSETEALLIALGKDAVPTLVDTLVTDLKGTGGIAGLSRSKDFIDRLIRILVAIGDDSIGRVVDALSDPHPQVRKTMLRILSGIVDDPDFGKDVDGWQRWYQIHKAAKDRRPGAVGKVIPFLEDKDRRIRLEAIRTLGKLGHKQAVPALLALFSRQKAKDVRIELVRSLAMIGDITAAPELINLLNSADPAMRAEAATALRFLTREMMGFDARAPAEKRDAAVRRWRRWWEKKVFGK
jgi:hypothetical protein